MRILDGGAEQQMICSNTDIAVFAAEMKRC